MPPRPFKAPDPTTTPKPKPKPKPKSKSTVSRKSSSNSKTLSKPTGPRASGSTPFSRSGISSARISLSDSEPDPFASTAEDRDRDEDDADDVDVDEEMREQEQEEERRENIPPELLTRLLHEFFKEEGTRLSKDANMAVGRYMETFVREALARAAFMRAEVEGGDGFLEVEDLEKLAPQLLLDF